MEGRQESELLTKKSSEMHRYDQIKSILAHCNFDTFAVFDLDNTLIEAKEILGSDQWFTKFFESSYKASPSKETEESVIKIYNAVQHHCELQATEPDAIKMIKMLQDIGIPVIALTARGAEISTPTIDQLKKIGIHFDQQWNNLSYTLHVKDLAKEIVFKDGVIFCSGLDKGKCLNSFFEFFNEKPAHILMVDDKEKHLNSVKKAALQKSSRFTGIQYIALDEKIKNVDLLEADAQMLEIVKHFPMDAKLAISKITSGKTAEFVAKNYLEVKKDEPVKHIPKSEKNISDKPAFFRAKRRCIRTQSCPDLTSHKIG